MNRKLKLDELKRDSVEAFKQKSKHPIVVVLDNIRSLNNVGSFFRTGDAFNIEKIYLCGITACPPHREIRKTALGATEAVDWEYVENTVEVVAALKAKGYKTCAVEQAVKTTLLQDLQIEENGVALIFGNEVEGVQDEVIAACDEVVEIPQFGTKHSLNVSVCGGAVLWEVTKKMCLKA
ncbi:RNA methyltransferase [Parvicella tangerina]|uniref:tRNA (Guanosine(18)-2'-O)-methyltransferase n=1 Tax=Parvicella tangerina TaxID=2829795 RepID=A0A916NJK9_9FLAO|nr:RNA methyltransferase [Parvicella tangerina]CAG5086979.1 tRNA (guanosine(18)-2'-O)-methyltransferase [Parvicella tangerina]